MASASARHCGAVALRVLEAGCGETIAVFQSTAYLANSAGELLCVGPASMPPGPINLCVERETLLLPAPGDSWSFDRRRLSTGNQRLATIDNEAIWHPPATLQPQADQLRAGLAIALPLLRQLETLPSLATVQTTLHAGLAALGEWQSHDPLPQRAIAILGCGEGLTPAGDDILCGYLVALHCLGDPAAQQLATAVKPLLSTHTSRISAAHLSAACEGAAVQLIHDLIDAIARNDRDDTSATITALNKYGHSSGYYAALGATQAIAHFTNSGSQTRNRSHSP